ncbi:MAG: hypothetical protein FJ118_02715 [Deltaproteobacteria bacterium]|nr:hypothetical protein [Deltaproteobacteria bacterium]
MKKSLITVVALVACMAFAGTVFASWDCFQPAYPTFKMPPCKDQVLCKGKTAGKTKLCGPCAPTISWKGSWVSYSLCPGSKMLDPKAAKKPAAKKAAPKKK